MNKFVIGAVVLGALVLAGCGSLAESNDHNLPDPNQAHNVSSIVWWRLDTPQNYPTIVRGCYRGNGIYENQDSSNSVEVVPNDPACR